jgi:hypothetical protein
VAASFAHAYPWGGSRVDVFTAPAAALFIGAGVSPVSAWLRARNRLLPGVLTAVLAAPFALAAYRVAVHWPRADCAGAAAYVLANRLPTDPVAANHWEYSYYFRGLGSAFAPLNEWTPQLPSRVWVVLTQGKPAAGAPLVDPINWPDWRVLDQREFASTSVYLLRIARE